MNNFDPEIVANRVVCAAYTEATFGTGIFKNTIGQTSDFGNDFSWLVTICEQDTPFSDGKKPTEELKTAVKGLLAIQSLPRTILFGDSQEVIALFRGASNASFIDRQVQPILDKKLYVRPRLMTRFMTETVWGDINRPNFFERSHDSLLPKKYDHLGGGKSGFMDLFMLTVAKARNLWIGRHDEYLAVNQEGVWKKTGIYHQAVGETTSPVEDLITKSVGIDIVLGSERMVVRDHKNNHSKMKPDIFRNPSVVAHQVNQLAADIAYILKDNLS